ncbi:cyclic nucleotide-binding domain-containing protein [Anaeromicropila herbilytica]|uniref:Catabolite gene activator protein n=1 Tax=Anaeromicropila herbilytica TaxID=2785025 RepID=A0A7R7EHR8_9FIRM|nr:cyclic nucleotide-binding domain-containing protein [Anaeromicropila herbilytica]BCN29455.1 catabolite gene activator protein [Anaeromicropila herbilytica]
MERIQDQAKLDYYIKKYSVNELFTKDMREYMELVSFKKNEYLISDKEDVWALMLLVSGKTKAFTTLSNGKSLLLRFYEGFQILGDLEVLTSKDTFTNVQAIEETYCIAIAFEYVNLYLLEDAKFLRAICRELGTKLKESSKNSSINLLYSLENRLASYIYTTGERVTQSGHNKIIFDENLTYIAEILGTSYRHLLRTLNVLCTKGVLSKCGCYYEVLDENTLMALSADLYR